MKYIFFILILLMLYTLFVVGRIKYIMWHAGNPSIQQLERTVGVGPVLRYIAAGDSTAVGEGASSVSQTYPNKVTEALSKTHSVVYKNIAVHGAQTSDVIDKQLAQIIEYNPDIVTLSIGANDATHLVWSAHIIANYQTIIGRLTKETHAQVYMTNVPNFIGASLLPRWYIRLLEYRSKQVNAELEKMESGRVHIVNIHDFGWAQFPDRSITYSPDQFHPSDTGYQNWTNAFLDTMK